MDPLKTWSRIQTWIFLHPWWNSSQWSNWIIQSDLSKGSKGGIFFLINLQNDLHFWNADIISGFQTFFSKTCSVATAGYWDIFLSCSDSSCVSAIGSFLRTQEPLEELCVFPLQGPEVLNQLLRRFSTPVWSCSALSYISMHAKSFINLYNHIYSVFVFCSDVWKYIVHIILISVGNKLEKQASCLLIMANTTQYMH